MWILSVSMNWLEDFVIFLFYCSFYDVFHLHFPTNQILKNCLFKVINVLAWMIWINLTILLQLIMAWFAIFIWLLKHWFNQFLSQKVKLLNNNLELIFSADEIFQWTFLSSHQQAYRRINHLKFMLLNHFFIGVRWWLFF